MNDEISDEIPPEWRFVHFREYPEPLDLTGKDVLTIVGRSKDEVAKIVGKLAAKGEMQTEEMPGENLVSSTGGFADEFHEWPNAIFGREFKHLILQFENGRLSRMQWKFQSAQSVDTPWWKLW